MTPGYSELQQGEIMASETLLCLYLNYLGIEDFYESFLIINLKMTMNLKPFKIPI